MKFYKNAIAAVLLVLAWETVAEKKIELTDIEADNLKSEKQKERDKNEEENYAAQPNNVLVDAPPGRDVLPLEFLKSGLLRLFEGPTHAIQQPRYIHQYAVTETPERMPEETVVQKPEFIAPVQQQPQQHMVGYLSNVPMQIYLVPQYYGETMEQTANSQPGIQYVSPIAKFNLSPQQNGIQSAQQQPNYVEVPTYVTPTARGYAAPAPQYMPQYTYVTYSPQPTVASNSHQNQVTAVASSSLVQQNPTAVGTYPAHYISYQSPLMAPPVYPKPYYPSYPRYTETNSVDDTTDGEEESKKQYSTQTEPPYTKTTVPEFPRYYTSRTPIKIDRRPSPVSDLPAPSPLLYGNPAHLSGIPKVLPYFRPASKPVYSHIPGNHLHSGVAGRPIEGGYSYGPKTRRPNSLLDSYVPSSVQLEYMKRGYGRDPLATYEALASGRHGYPQVSPRNLERGFLPNQIYHTGAGGVTFGHYKRTAKSDKNAQN